MLSILRTQLGRNSVWMLGGFGLRLAMQAVYFVIIARILGPAQYGAFAAVVALVATMCPFSGWGTGNILIREVARKAESFGRYWGAAVATSLVSGVGLCVLALVLGPLIVGQNILYSVLVLIAASDLVFTRLSAISGQAFQAFERLKWTAFLQILGSLLRLAGAILLMLLPSTATAVSWSICYFVSGVVAGCIGLLAVRTQLGWGKLSLAPMRGEVREGFYFALGSSSQGTYNDIDKTLVGRLDSLEAAGSYSAAYRVFYAIFAPVQAVLFAGYARFFRAGKSGVRGSYSFARKVLPVVLMYSCGATIVMVAVAPVLTRILGTGYSEAAHALLWIAPLPILKTISYMAADTLTGGGRQSVRTLLQVIVAVTNVALNIFLIPKFGWIGAAWATLVTDALLALMLWVVVFRLARDR